MSATEWTGGMQRKHIWRNMHMMSDSRIVQGQNRDLATNEVYGNKCVLAMNQHNYPGHKIL